MNSKRIILFSLLVIVSLQLIPEAEAASTCTISTIICMGQSYVDTSTGGLLGAVRCFFFDTDSVSTHTCSSTQDRLVWQLSAGQCLTLYYYDMTSGATPPQAPNQVTLKVKIDNSATDVITFLNAGTEPANATPYTFCATNDGLITGTPRAGTYRLYVQAIKNNGGGGIGNYNIDSDGVATVGTIVQNARGAIRSMMLVSSLSASAPPSGSQFAYGPSADELVTITVTRTQKNGGTTTETINFNSLHQSGGSVVETSTTTESTASTTDTTTFIIDNSYDLASNTYDIEYNIISTASLTGMSWTTFPISGHGVDISRISATKVRATGFTADPRIITDMDGSGTFATADNLFLTKLGSSSGSVITLFNRGEIVYSEGYIYNSRSQLLSRAMTLTVQDTALTNCHSIGSVTPVSNKYSYTRTIATTATCLAANDLIGSARTLLITNTGQSHRSGNNNYVSSYYWVDYHPQQINVLDKDDFPSQDATEDLQYVISADVMYIWCHAKGVRLDLEVDTGTNAVTITETETDDITVIDTFTTQTGSDGWSTAFDTVNPTAPARTIHGHCTVTHNGNTGTIKQSIGWVSAFTADKICRLWRPDVLVPNVEIRVFVHVEKNQGPIAPDEVPTFYVDTVNENNEPETWDNIVTSDMYNVVDDTQTVNGALYYYDWTPTQVLAYNILITCNIQGALLQFDYSISEVDMTEVTLNIEPYTLLIFAVAFLAIIAEWKKDGLYWFMSIILSIYLLINRPSDSLIPVAIFVGWIFIGIYQFFSLVATGKEKPLTGDE